MIFHFIKNKPEINVQEGTKLTIYGDMKSIKNLKEIEGIKHLYIINIKQLEFEYLIENYNSCFEFIYFYNMRATDLSKLSMLKNIKLLALEWNTKTNRLWDIAKNTNLLELYISDFYKVSTLEDLRNSQTIQKLYLSGGMCNPLKVESLEPLSSLIRLKKLSLSNIRVFKESLIPISTLINLEELELPNQFPTKDYAMLSMKLKNTQCDYFAPYVKLEQEIDGKDIMVIGKRKPFLNSKLDEIKLNKYIEEFKCMQNEFK